VPPESDAVGDPPRGPIFLAGCDRAGIGLCADILNAHPHIYISRRTRFWDRIFERHGDLTRPEAAARAIRSLVEQPRVAELQPDARRLQDDLAAMGHDASYAALFRLLHEHLLAQIGKERWGDKTLGAEQHADVVLALYPTAQMIHVVRDPRDRYASQSLHRSAPRGAVGAGTGIWLSSIRLARRNALRYPTRYRVVRYEDIVTDPDSTIRGLCEFLGEPFAEAMLVAPGPPQRLGGRSPHRSEPSPLVATSVGRYAEDLGDQEIAFIQLLAGRWMRRLGYHTESVDLSRSRAFRFWAVTVPVNLIRMLAWRINAALRRTGS